MSGERAQEDTGRQGKPAAVSGGHGNSPAELWESTAEAVGRGPLDNRMKLGLPSLGSGSTHKLGDRRRGNAGNRKRKRWFQHRCQTRALHAVWWAEKGSIQNAALWACGSDCLVSHLSHSGHSLNLFNESIWAASRGQSGHACPMRSVCGQEPGSEALEAQARGCPRGLVACRGCTSVAKAVLTMVSPPRGGAHSRCAFHAG